MCIIIELNILKGVWLQKSKKEQNKAQIFFGHILRSHKIGLVNKITNYSYEKGRQEYQESSPKE